MAGAAVQPARVTLSGSDGLRLNFYTPEPDSREREALALLASRASTGTVVPSGNDRPGND